MYKMAQVHLMLFILSIIYGLTNNFVNADDSDGDCGQPKPPPNGKVNCSGNKCVASCDKGYNFADGSSEVSLECSKGEWYVFGNKWNNEKYNCEKQPSNARHKSGRSKLSKKSAAGLKFCQEKIQDKRFEGCKEKLHLTSILIDACSWNYCYCDKKNPEDCACDKIAEYVTYCSENGGPSLTNWRDEHFCPIACSGGRVFTNCAPKQEAVCGSATSIDNSTCTEGCTCPNGTVLNKDKCIKEDKCPCLYGGKEYKNGKKVKQDCNNCVCKKGYWDCKPYKCESATCAANGDPHYTTFDGRKFDFMGNCSYHIVQTNDFDVIGNNAAWYGGSYVDYKPGLATCTKSVTVLASGHEIFLDQGPTASIDNTSVTTFPYTVSDITIRKPSANEINVILLNGVVVKWDGMYNVYVTVPPSYAGKTKGLCGNSNDKPNDDLIEPNGSLANDTDVFGNSWKTEESCPNNPPPPSPCDSNPQNQQTAESECGKLNSDIFKDCQKLVNAKDYYNNCVYDSCACGDDISKCMCSSVSSYAEACRAKGVVIDWRKSFDKCPMQCPAGQQYQLCVSPCDGTCSEISANATCAPQCIEDCRCPTGQTLNDEGKCIPKSECGCPNDGKNYPDGQELIRSGQICTCTNAMWICDNKCNVENQTIQIDCNSCVCQNGQLTSCTNDTCPDGCLVKNSDGQNQVIKAGDLWQDGPCTNCTCSKDPQTGYRLECKTQNCTAVTIDNQNYAYSNETKPSDCCPTFTIIACKYQGKVYQPGESWTIDKCKTGRCVRANDGKLTKREVTTTCNTKCDAGYEYQDSNTTCCGTCVQVACVYDGDVKQVGDTWKSDDGCITYTCETYNGEIGVFSEREICPDLTDCPPDNVVTDDCCQICNLPQSRNRHERHRHQKHKKSRSKHV